MKLGINTSPRVPLVSADAYAAVATAAERLGYDFLSVSDHVVVTGQNASRYPYNDEGRLGAETLGHCFDQLTTLAFLAGCTSRIRLMTSVMVVPHRPPVLAAKMLATADVLSKGRLIVGCGAGWLREEFEALQTRPFDDRGRVTDEYIEAFRTLWTEERPSYAGTHVRFPEVVFYPKPLQKPLPPLWIGGESMPAKRRAARLGTAWYPGSRNPQFRLDTPARLAAGIADVRRLAEQEKRDPASIDIAYALFSPVDRTAQPGHDTPRRLMTGNPADMAADIAALADVGVRHVNLSFQTPSLEEMLARMQQFAEEVMPLVRR